MTPARGFTRSRLAHAYTEYRTKRAGNRHLAQWRARDVLNKPMPMIPDLNSVIGCRLQVIQNLRLLIGAFGSASLGAPPQASC
eukprot:883828-Pyramimonas_sp.AAC.1